MQLGLSCLILRVLPVTLNVVKYSNCPSLRPLLIVIDAVSSGVSLLSPPKEFSSGSLISQCLLQIKASLLVKLTRNHLLLFYYLY